MKNSQTSNSFVHPGRRNDPTAVMTWRLFDHARSRSMRRYSMRITRILEANRVLEPWNLILWSLLLLETRERPRVVRGVEWFAFFCHLAPDLTCGPFQMRNAPFRFEKSVQEAVLRLKARGCIPSNHPADLDFIALIWNGSSARQTGSCLSYPQALYIACRLHNTAQVRGFLENSLYALP